MRRIERTSYSIGISSQLAMPYESLGSLERIYFVQKIVSRGSSSTIAIHLDPVLMDTDANYNPQRTRYEMVRCVEFSRMCVIAFSLHEN